MTTESQELAAAACDACDEMLDMLKALVLSARIVSASSPEGAKAWPWIIEGVLTGAYQVITDADTADESGVSKYGDLVVRVQELLRRPAAT